MLRKVNIDGVLYPIGDARFEGDNFAYIQVPESITVGTPLTDLAPIQKALDSTDGSLLYAPSLNVFFAPTASSTPATTRIWASTTGDKGYQLKATLNESGILSSAVVVEASDHPIVLYGLRDIIPAMSDSILEPVTTPEALAVAKAIRQDNWKKLQFLNYNMMGQGGIYLQIQPLLMELVTDTRYFEEFKIGEQDNGFHCRIYYSDDTYTTISGIAIANDICIPLDTWIELRQATEALTTDLFVNSQKAIDYGAMMYQLCCVAQPESKQIFKIQDQDEVLGQSGYVHVNTESKTLSDGKQYFVYHFEIEDYKSDLRIGTGATKYPLYNIDVYMDANASGSTLIKGLRIEGLPPEDCVKVAKEYMEVPTGDTSHPCLEASVSGTTLNITHKNESHISSVIHVPKSVLFTSDNVFKLGFQPIGALGGGAYTPNAKIEISYDGKEWITPTWNESTGITLNANILNSGLGKYSVFIKSDNHINEINGSGNTCGFVPISGNGIEVSGVLDALWGGKEIRENECAFLFSSMNSITSAKRLVFPTKTAPKCYESMFELASVLVTPPEILPADEVAEEAYSAMFAQCTQLKSPPVLPATSLNLKSCYRMFLQCQNLETPPVLPTLSMAESCYEEMFAGCLALQCAPALPAIELAVYCYLNMFVDCVALITPPDLPATTLPEGCYGAMFLRCHALNSPITFPTILSMGEYCMASMFEDCTSLTSAPELPATTLAKYCCQSMFEGCTSLISVPTLPMESLAEGCYHSMFKGCTSLTKPMEIKTMYIPTDSMVSMFEDCTGIKWATEGIPYSIEAWGIEAGAVADMFKGNSGDIPEGTGTPENWTTYYLYVESTEYVFTWNDAATEGFELSSNYDSYWEYIDSDSAAGQDTPWFNDEWIEKVKDGRTDFTVKIMNIASKDHVVNNVSETFVYDEDYTGDGAAFKSPNAYIEFYMSDEYNPSPGMALTYGQGIPFVFTVEWIDELKSQLTYNTTYSCWELDVTDSDIVLAAAPWACENFSRRERYGYGVGDVVKMHVVSPDGTYNKEFTFTLDSSSSTRVAFKSESPEGYFSIYNTSGDWKRIVGSFY